MLFVILTILMISATLASRFRFTAHRCRMHEHLSQRARKATIIIIGVAWTIVLLKMSYVETACVVAAMCGYFHMSSSWWPVPMFLAFAMLVATGGYIVWVMLKASENLETKSLILALRKVENHCKRCRRLAASEEKELKERSWLLCDRLDRPCPHGVHYVTNWTPGKVERYIEVWRQYLLTSPELKLRLLRYFGILTPGNVDHWIELSDRQRRTLNTKLQRPEPRKPGERGDIIMLPDNITIFPGDAAQK